MRTKQEQIEKMMLDVPQTIVSYDANPKGQHLYGEQRLQIAEALYNAGYRRVLIDTENGKAVDCAQYTPWQLIEAYTEREVKKVRKDTAKAILNVLYFNLKSNVKANLAKSSDYYSVMGRIQEIAKNYGVEIEE